MPDGDRPLAPETGIRVVRVVVEELAFSHREDYLDLPAGTRADLGQFSMTMSVGLTDDGLRALLRFVVETNPKDRPVYNIKLRMAGFLEATPDAQPPLRDFAIDGGPALMIPFVREALAAVTGRGNFGTVWLRAINTRPISEGLRRMGPGQVAAAQPAAGPRPKRKAPKAP